MVDFKVRGAVRWLLAVKLISVLLYLELVCSVAVSGLTLLPFLCVCEIEGERETK